MLSIPTSGVLQERAPLNMTIGSITNMSITSRHNYAESISLTYQSIGNYFTIPNHTWNGSALSYTTTKAYDSYTNILRYQMVTNDSSSSSSHSHAQSMIQQTRIEIQNVNDPTSITFPSTQPIEVIPLPGTDTTSSTKSVVPLHGFIVMDPDYGVDVIKVQINTTRGGILTLNPAAYPYLDFNSATYCYSSERSSSSTSNSNNNSSSSLDCIGDTKGKNMVFVASPDVLAVALNGMTYETVGSNFKDTIHITLFDGNVSIVCCSSSFAVFSFHSDLCLIYELGWTMY